MYRNTLFFDESGEEKMPQEKIPSSSKDRFFIYTSVIMKNSNIYSYQKYYSQIKNKNLKDNLSFHSSDFFHTATKQKINFINVLAEFLDTISFQYITVIVDKKKMFDKQKQVTPYEPMDTSLRKALSIHLEKNDSQNNFYTLQIKEILKEISQYKFWDKSDYYPLEISYKTILEIYFNKLYPDPKKKPLTKICFETSPNKERLLHYTDILRNPMNHNEKTDLSNHIYKYIYDISFPFKKAQYLGLEIADLIGYGYNLEINKRLSKVPMYKPIRTILLNKLEESNQLFGKSYTIIIP